MAKALRALALLAALQLSDAFLAIPTARPAERSGVVMMGGRKATPLGRTSTTAGKMVNRPRTSVLGPAAVVHSALTNRPPFV
jgi:hypothetical protein